MNETCPKCGYDKNPPMVRYIRVNDYDCIKAGCRRSDEHLHVICYQCQFTESVDTRDAETAGAR